MNGCRGAVLAAVVVTTMVVASGWTPWSGDPLGASVPMAVGSSPTLRWVNLTDTREAYFDDGVDPDFGSAGVTFAFRIRFSDPDNDPPTYVNAFVNSAQYPMSKENPSCTSYSTTGCIYLVSLPGAVIPLGWNVHHFTTKDAASPEVRYPEVSNATGPLLNDGSPMDVVLDYMYPEELAATDAAPFNGVDATVDHYLPLAGYLDTRGRSAGTMFDGLIFYHAGLHNQGGAGPIRNFGKVSARSFANGIFWRGNGPPADVQDDPCSTQRSSPLCNLDAAVVTVRTQLGPAYAGYRMGIFVAAPIPCRVDDGSPGSTGFADDACAVFDPGTNEEQAAWTKALMTEIVDWFAKSAPQGLSLVGFYQGYREGVATNDPQLFQQVSTHAHTMGLKMLWIPYCGVDVSSWYAYGFDWATLQPNYAWVGCQSGSEGKNDYQATFGYVDTQIRTYGLSGAELELSHETRGYEDLRGNAHAYIDAGFEYRWFKSPMKMSTYFNDGISAMDATTRDGVQPQMRDLYDRLYLFLHPSTDLALEKTAAADVFGVGYEPSKAVEGTLRNYWSTAGAGTWPHWWRVDLGQSTWVAEVIIRYSTVYYYNLKLEGSTQADCGLMTTISDRTLTPNLSPQVFRDINAAYRCLRVTFTGWGCLSTSFTCYNIAHLYEVEVTPLYAGAAFDYLPVADAYADSGNPNSNFGASASLWIGTTSGQRKYYTFLKFDVRSTYLRTSDAKRPRDLMGAYVYVTYYRASCTGALATVVQFVAAYHVPTDSWTESGIKWSNKPTEDTLPLNPHTVWVYDRSSTSSPERYERPAWDVSTRLHTDADGTLSILLRLAEDPNSLTTDQTGQVDAKELRCTDSSGDTWGSWFYPFLVIMAY